MWGNIYFSLIGDRLGNSLIKFWECTRDSNNEIIDYLFILIIESSEAIAKHTSFVGYIFIKDFSEFFIGVEELLENLIWVISKTIPTFKFSIGIKAFFEFLPPIFIIEGSFDWITKNFKGFSYLWEMIIGGGLIFFGIFGIPS